MKAKEIAQIVIDEINKVKALQLDKSEEAEKVFDIFFKQSTKFLDDMFKMAKARNAKRGRK